MPSPLTLEALRILDAIARRGSFAAAAEELNKAPSAITYNIQKLEQELDVQLFDRTGHKAVLTPAGLLMLEGGRQLLDAAEQLTEQTLHLANGWEPKLRISIDGLFEIATLFPLLQKFKALETGTHIELFEETLVGNWDALASNRSDLAIGAPDYVRSGNGYSTELLGEVSMLFCAAPEHPICQLPQPLQEYDLKQFTAVVARDSARQLTPRNANIIQGQPQLTVPSIGAKIDAQIAGLGVGYLPKHRISQQLKQGSLIPLDVANSGAQIDSALMFAWQPEKNGKALRWFIRQLRRPDNPFTLLLSASS